MIKRFTLVFLLSFALFLVVLAPASRIAPLFIEDTDRYTGSIYGSIWQGGMNNNQQSMVIKSNISWQFNYQSLLDMAPTWQVELANYSLLYKVPSFNINNAVWELDESLVFKAKEPGLGEILLFDLEAASELLNSCSKTLGRLYVKNLRFNGQVLPDGSGKVTCQQGIYTADLSDQNRSYALLFTFDLDLFKPSVQFTYNDGATERTVLMKNSI